LKLETAWDSITVYQLSGYLIDLKEIPCKANEYGNSMAFHAISMECHGNSMEIHGNT